MEKLALLGGSPVLDHAAMPADLFRWPIFTEEDEAAVLEVFRANKMSGNDITLQFEKEFAAWQQRIDGGERAGGVSAARRRHLDHGRELMPHHERVVVRAAFEAAPQVAAADARRRDPHPIPAVHAPQFMLAPCELSVFLKNQCLHSYHLNMIVTPFREIIP